MIWHQGICIKTEGIAGFVFRKVGEIRLKIGLVQEDRLFLVSPSNHMVESAGKMNAGSPSHETLVA